LELFTYIILALVALSVLVFFHELGHFSVAKAFGVKIERFSIGFGKPFYKKYWAGTEWVFAPILLGGYVKMKGQDDLDPKARSNDPDSYNSKKPWQRILILLAGPLANIILAFFIYLIIAFNGAPVTTARDYVPAVVGKVGKNTPAQIAGLKEGDKILSIGATKIKYWYELKDAIQNSSEPIILNILRDNKVLTLKLNTKKVEDKNEFNELIKRKVIGIRPKASKDMIIHFNIIDAFKYAYLETKKATF